MGKNGGAIQVPFSACAQRGPTSSDFQNRAPSYKATHSNGRLPMRLLLLMVLATTGLAVTVQGQNQTVNFDKDAAGTAPAGWTVTKTGTGNAKWTVEKDD